ncbi:hypothetical protein KVR01_000577 [Diaporthe batatas]|uniref:uncharacterized protein n=1 Tax=Diaporthe batatas TaxID=748121 RepID=UPI001D037909|nr:uncharacterized protein KVR01_000577 [Diaporthe batatas]KAG8169832.1 hypothetical protein KVR01_000577 [Diaporthe batatas]
MISISHIGLQLYLTFYLRPDLNTNLNILQFINMEDTLRLSELVLDESGKMNHYDEDEVQDTELLFDASAHEDSDATSGTDGSLESENDVGSEYSLESEEILDGDDEVNVVEKIDAVASVGVDDEQDDEEEDLDEEDGELNSQLEVFEDVEDEEIGVGTSEEVQVGPKKSKWFAEWLRQREERYN